MKVFISQPMSGLAEKEIIETRNRAKAVILNAHINGVLKEKNEYYCDYSTLTFIDNLQKDKDPRTTGPLEYLGEDIKMLEEADLVYFCAGWQESRGCNIEFQVTKEYGIPVMFEGVLN